VAEREVADGAGAEGAQVVGMPVDGVAAQVEAERLLFEAQQLHLVPWRAVRDPDDRQSAAVAAAAEEIRLAPLAVPLRAAAVLEGPVDGAEERGAAAGERHARRQERVARAGLDQRFEDALVADAEVHLL